MSTDGNNETNSVTSNGLSDDFPVIPHLAELGPEFESSSELDGLREILWGRHVRDTTNRFVKVESALDSATRDIQDRFDEKLRASSETGTSKLNTVQLQLTEHINNQGNHASNQLRTARQELSDRIDRIADKNDTDMHELKRELMTYIDQRADQQANQLRQAQEEITARIETLAEDLFTQIRQTQKSLTDQLAAQADEQAERVNLLRADTQESDNGLRADILTHIGQIEEKLTGRQDLGKLYMELGRRLYNK